MLINGGRLLLAGGSYSDEERDVGDDVAERGSIYGRRTPPGPGTGEFITEAILATGAPSINEFERVCSSEPRFRSIFWQKNYKELIRKALVLAKHEVGEMSFTKLCKLKYDNEETAINFFKCLSIEESWEWLQNILTHNDLDHIEFFHTVFDIMDKQTVKRNTLLFIGPPNGGKTLLAESMARAAMFYCNIQSFAKGKQFLFMDAVGVRCIMINEPRITDEYVETLKNILEGCPTHVDVKYETGQMIPKTPVVVTSNQPLAMYVQSNKEMAQNAYDARCIKYTLRNMPSLIDCRKGLHPGVWFLAAKELKLRGHTFEDSDLIIDM